MDSVDNEYLTLLKALIEMGEVVKDTLVEQDRRVLDAKGLVIKFLYHCASAYSLSYGTHLPEIHLDSGQSFKPAFLDQASIAVLVRTAHETFLTFHYVFGSTTNIDEQDFRYWTWLIMSMISRQKLSTILRESKNKQITEEKELQKLQNKLENNSTYQKLTTGQRKGIIKKGNWRFQSKLNGKGLDEIGWHALGIAAGLNHRISYDYYDYLCSYAHAGSWAIPQIEQMIHINDKQDFVKHMLDQLKIYMSFMCKTYTVVFPKSTIILKRNQRFKNLIDNWFYVGSTEPTSDSSSSQQS
jgi:hypothetical protein